MLRRRHVLWILLLVPTAAFADGVSPILNFFHKDTWLPASIVTLVIIVVEGGLLRWRIKQVPFITALWRSAVLNAASSAAGSVLLLAFGRDSFFMWDTMSMVLPLFAITAASEIPLLRLLYRQVRLSWGRACVLSTGVNVASYACVFALEIGLLLGWLSYAGHLDTKEQSEWQSPQLLDRVTGRIYATVTSGPTHGLRVLDPQTGTWAKLTNCPSLDPNTWDIRRDVCAFVPWNMGESKDRHLVIAKLPGFVVLQDMRVTRFMDAASGDSGGWQGVKALSLSPDARSLAILFRYADAVAYKDGSSHYSLGGKCRVIVLDVDSGREIARAPRWASEHGVCWLPDATTVLFSSFEDEKLYQTSRSEVRGNTSYGVDDSKGGKFARSIYACRLGAGDVARFSDGTDPALVSQRNLVLIRDRTSLRLLDPSGHEEARLDISRLGYSGVVISPDGALLLAEIQRHFPFYPGGLPVLIDTTAPSVRHAIDGDFSYKYVWVDSIDATPDQASDVTARKLAEPER